MATVKIVLVISLMPTTEVDVYEAPIDRMFLAELWVDTVYLASGLGVPPISYQLPPAKMMSAVSWCVHR